MCCHLATDERTRPHLGICEQNTADRAAGRWDRSNVKKSPEWNAAVGLNADERIYLPFAFSIRSHRGSDQLQYCSGVYVIQLLMLLL